MNVLDEARELVEKRLAVLNEEAESLQRALVELGGSNGKPGRKPSRGGGRPKGSGNKAKRGGGRRKRGGLTRQDQVLAHVKDNPTARTKDIATAIGISTNQVSGLLTKSKGEGKLSAKANGEYVVVAAPVPAAASSDGGSKKATAKKGGRGKAKASKKAAAKAPATEAKAS